MNLTEITKRGIEDQIISLIQNSSLEINEETIDFFNMSIIDFVDPYWIANKIGMKETLLFISKIKERQGLKQKYVGDQFFELFTQRVKQLSFEEYIFLLKTMLQQKNLFSKNVYSAIESLCKIGKKEFEENEIAINVKKQLIVDFVLDGLIAWRNEVKVRNKNKINFLSVSDFENSVLTFELAVVYAKILITYHKGLFSLKKDREEKFNKFLKELLEIMERVSMTVEPDYFQNNQIIYDLDQNKAFILNYLQQYGE